MGLNAHRVFAGAGDTENYLVNLTLAPRREDVLREARDVCREALKVGLADWGAVVAPVELFEARVADAAPAALRPKFRMQGSFAYRTLNEPAWTPPQEIDLDDGIFIPVSFFVRDGEAHPVLLSSGYFRAVEAVLAPLCKRQGWTLVTEKPSCVRVEIDAGAHIDFALYAIPDSQFEALVEAELAKSLAAMDRALVMDSVEFAEPIYRELRDDQIMLAHREEGWKPSDPRKLEAWFRQALRDYGEQLRRICRYLKGWRDHRWEGCRLSSIALMSCAVDAYRAIGSNLSESRDDLALLAVAAQLSGLLNERIANPVVDGQYLDEAWTPQDRAGYVAAARELHARLQGALQGTDNPQAALAELTAAFGDRIPDDADLIRSEGAPAAPAVLTSGLLKSNAAESGPQAAVKRDGDRRYG